MKRWTLQQTTQSGPANRKGGAALIVVISLLAALAFLGFLFYGFAKQELASAEFFADSQTQSVPLPPDVFWDWFLEQFVVGTDASLTNSALYGNKYSLLANMLGTPNTEPLPGAPFASFATVDSDVRDLTFGNGGTTFRGDTQPFDGAGIGTIVTALNDPTDGPLVFGFDINQDGVFDATNEPDWQTFVMNFSPAADAPNGASGPYTFNGTAFSGSQFYRDYEPDAGYTYPDLNSPFLSYDAVVRGWVDGDATNARNYRVIIPSFFRPQLLPAFRGTNDTTSGNPSGTRGYAFGDLNNDGNFDDGLYTHPDTARKVLRPHRDHLASFAPTYRRFISALDPQYTEDLDGNGTPDGDVDGDGNSDGVKAKSGDTNRVLFPFPFRVDLDNDGNYNEMGVWTNPYQGEIDTGFGGQVNYELDVDTDGDGVRDAIWMDLDFPIMTMPDGRQFVPMFAVKAIDLDALINVNAHGNAHGLFVRLTDGTIEVIGPDSTPIVGPTGLAETMSFHQSNLGLSRSEVNLSLTLTGDLRNGSHVDPAADDPPNVLNNQDAIASQFELATNYEYTPATAYPGPVPAPSVEAIANLEALMILNGRRVFERLRNNNVRETREQILGRNADRFKIRELYRTLANSTLADGGQIPAPLPGGWALDDNGNSNILGLSTVFPDPGNLYPNGDDDIDAPGIGTFNFRRGGGSYFADAELYDVQVPPFVHPLDYLGTGRDYLDLAGTTLRLGRLLGNGISTTTNPMRWPSYLTDSTGTASLLGLWQYQRIPFDDGVVDQTGVLPWHQALIDLTNNPGNVLQVENVAYDFLLDEPSEVILEPDFRNPEYDGVYPTYEMEAMHLSAGDVARTKTTGRLQELASINFKHVKESVASTIRRRITTDSWDRLEPAQTRFQAAFSAAFDRQWEYTNWTGGNADFQSALPTFPPEFGTVATPVPAGSATDPFRPELRMLLKNERRFAGNMTGDNAANSMGRYPRHKLNINRLLSGETTVAPATSSDIDRRAFDDDGNPRFRNLTPHPIFEVGDPVIASIPAVLHANVQPGTEHTHPSVNDADVDFINIDAANASIGQRKKAQEWWARYDRQRLARDIYVLLYTLGSGLDGLSAIDNTPTTPYPINGTTDLDSDGINDNLQAMAQFAVNYVDALDRDNVITRFEYDTNLSDGWSWTTGGPVANGVEAQQLTFSEALWVQTADLTSDDASSYWDDTEIRNFLHLELRNVTPFDVDFADETWRIARVDNSTDPPTVLAAFEWQQPVAATYDDKVPAGRTYLIACQDNTMVNGGDILSGDMYHDFDGAVTGLDAVVPYRSDGSGGALNPLYPTGSSGTPPEPMADLDLSYTVSTGLDDQNRFTFTLQYPGTLPGTLVSDADSLAPAPITLSLQRRRHLATRGIVDFTNDAQALEDANEGTEWIEVDQIEVTPATYDPATNTPTDIPSTERDEPLVRNLSGTNTGAGMRSHTLGDPSFDLSMRTVTNNNIDTIDRNRGNDRSPTSMAIWQPHFDRDFSSVYELFAVPISGPDDLTARLTDINYRMSGDYDDAGIARPAIAGELFESTDPQGDTDVTTGVGLDNDNRWYRVLEFLEVPNRAEEAIRERLVDIVRTPGRLNLNTMRHEEVLAALIDDPAILKFDSPTGQMTDLNNLAPVYQDTSLGFANWMDELRLSRDGIDPINYLAPDQFGGAQADRAYIPLPGIPGAPANPSDTTAPYSTTVGTGRPQFGANPFLSMSYLNPYLTDILDPSATPAYVDPISRTILRSHVPPIGQGSVNPEAINRVSGMEDLDLFEARPTTDVGTDSYDFHTRHRLLAKIANNSTNRSNVFAVWVTVEFFEAHQPLPATNPEIVQVGAKLEGSPTHRGFFILDRTRLERAVDTDSITNPADNDGRNDAFRFDWRDLVIHRRTIQ